MKRILSAFAALTLAFSLSTGDALAKKGDDGTIKFDKIGAKSADDVFAKAQTLNDKLVGAKAKLVDIKAKIAAAKDNPEGLKTAKTNLAALAKDLESIPGDIDALVKAAKAVKPGSLGLKGMALIKGGKNLATNAAKLPKLATNASALIKEIKDTTAGLK